VTPAGEHIFLYVHISLRGTPARTLARQHACANAANRVFAARALFWFLHVRIHAFARVLIHHASFF
jgi:hypothetical protein